jgi:hypothetical protein
VKRLGTRASHGCVRLHPANAATLFSLVQKHGMANTRIEIGNGASAPVPSVRNGGRKLASGE